MHMLLFDFCFADYIDLKLIFWLMKSIINFLVSKAECIFIRRKMTRIKAYILSLKTWKIILQKVKKRCFLQFVQDNFCHLVIIILQCLNIHVTPIFSSKFPYVSWTFSDVFNLWFSVHYVSRHSYSMPMTSEGAPQPVLCLQIIN